jgi:hypothetical protein
MRRKTFDRLMKRVEAAENVVDHHTAVIAENLFRNTLRRSPIIIEGARPLHGKRRIKRTAQLREMRPPDGRS